MTLSEHMQLMWVLLLGFLFTYLPIKETVEGNPMVRLTEEDILKTEEIFECVVCHDYQVLGSLSSS